MKPSALASALASAEVFLEHGDYGCCLSLLSPLAEKYPLPSIEGSKIRMLMVTAFIGKGEQEKAISTCRLISKSKDLEIRQNAKQLLSVLEG